MRYGLTLPRCPTRPWSRRTSPTSSTCCSRTSSPSSRATRCASASACTPPQARPSPSARSTRRADGSTSAATRCARRRLERCASYATRPRATATITACASTWSMPSPVATVGRAGRRVLPSRTGREERTTAAPTTSDRAKGATHLFLLRGRPATPATAPGAPVCRGMPGVACCLPHSTSGHGPVSFASMVRLTPLACRARARRAAFILAGVFNELFRRSCAHGVGYRYTCVYYI
mmetsp:Transcript_46897/g.112343  ORF Transcript_46897/g.112343 Transcript_46897/m.112343 type:complete len:234 (+) Transcript_46897:83-784(+)